MMSSTPQASSASDADLQNAFRCFDTDGNGFISLEELKQVMENLDVKMSMEEVKEMLREVDDDNDGNVSFEGQCVHHIVRFRIGNETTCIINKTSEVMQMMTATAM